MALSIDTVFDDYNTHAVPSSGDKKPRKPEIRALLKQIQNQSGLAVTRNTYAALAGVTPPTENYMGIVLDDPDATKNGYYSRVSAAWVWERGLPDTHAFLTNVVGSANTIIADVPAAVNPADVTLFSLVPAYANTGAVTVNGTALLGFDGQPLEAGFIQPGAAILFARVDSNYRLLVDHRFQQFSEQVEGWRDETDADRIAAEAARDIAAGYASDAVSQGNVPIYATVVGMAAISVPVGINAVRVNGYGAAGDGGGSMYVKVGVQPTHDGKFQSLDGAWWELAPDKKTVTPQMFGAKGDGAQDDHPAIQAGLNFLWSVYNGGTLYLPASDYLVKSTVRLGETSIAAGDGMSNISIIGTGWASRIIASADFDGSDQATKNNIISANNFSGPVTSHAGYPQKNILLRDFLIDGSLQSADEVPDDHFVGFSLAGFEVLNVDFVRVFNLKFVKCFGNGLVFGTQDPRQTAEGYQNGLRGCVAEDNWFEDCCRGLLPQYSSVTSPGGVTGSVIQAGSTLAVSIRNNTCVRPGGPFLDIFNADGATIEGNIVNGFSYTPGGHSPIVSTLYQQTVGTIRSDFGLKRSWIVNNRCHGIILNGSMLETFFNGEVPTPGPLDCTIKGNKIINPVGAVGITAPAIGASGATYENTSTRPMFVFVIGGTGIALERRRGTDGSFVSYTPGYLTSIQLAAGDAVKLTYSTPPDAWSWQIAPNLFAPGIQIAGGSVSDLAGQVHGNTVEDNTVIAPGQQCFAGIDCFDNALRGNHFEQPYFAAAGAAVTFEKSYDLVGCGNEENDINGNTFVDTRSPKFMSSNIEFINGSGAIRNINNTIHDNRLEATTGTPVVVNSSQDYIKNNHGPGRKLAALTSPTVAASAVELLNPFPYDCRVIVLGGTVTEIAFGPPGATQVYGATGGLVHVRHREVIKITYSVAPTVFNWFAE